MEVKQSQNLSKLGKEYPIILQQYLEDRKNKESLSQKYLFDQKKPVNLVSLC